MKMIAIAATALALLFASPAAAESSEEATCKTCTKKEGFVAFRLHLKSSNEPLKIGVQTGHEAKFKHRSWAGPVMINIKAPEAGKVLVQLLVSHKEERLEVFNGVMKFGEKLDIRAPKKVGNFFGSSGTFQIECLGDWVEKA